MNTSKPAWRKAGITLLVIGVLGGLLFALTPSYFAAFITWSGLVGGALSLLLSLFGKAEAKPVRRR